MYVTKFWRLCTCLVTAIFDGCVAGGEPDITALDKLISGFEDQFSSEELDPNIWKAYFRANAEYCTRCSLCEDSLAQERMLQASKAPGPGHVTRPQDISSDEDDDDELFDPLVVSETYHRTL